MRVIPVLDVLNGVVVRAKGGERERYSPVDSVLCSSPDPVEVIGAFEREFGFREAYLADLDAIQNGSPNFSLLEKIGRNTKMELMVDAGIDTVPKAEAVLGAGVSKGVVGSETLEELDNLKDILEGVGRGRVIASVDAKGGRVLSKCDELNGRDPEVVAKIFEDVGVRELIFLELRRVGTESGVDLLPLERILKEVEIPVMVGGGIGSIEDILELRNIGASGVLVATSLHEGNITKEDIERL